VKEKEMTVEGLNKAFGADTSVFDLINWEILTKNKIGFAMAVFAW